MLSNLTFQSNSPHSTPSNKGPIKRFHRQFIRTFHPLPSRGKIKELALRIATVAVAPFVYLAWSIQICSHFLFRKSKNSFTNRATLGLSSKKKSFSGSNLLVAKPIASWKADDNQKTSQNPDSPSLSLDEALAPTNNPIPQDLQSKLQVMKILKKSRLDNVRLELDRLKKNAILSTKIEKIIDKTIAQFKKDFRKENRRPSKTLLTHCNDEEVKMTLGRTLEIKNLFQDTHYIFTHGQDARWFIVSCLIKELVKCFDPSRDVHHFKFLRPPQFVNGNKVNDWKQKLSSNLINDHQPEVREALISVDSHLFNATLAESAVCYLNQNVSESVPELKIFNSILSKFLQNDSAAFQMDILAQRLLTLSNKIDKAVCGNFFVICVPKAMIDNSDSSILFRSHPYGRPCNCHSKNRAIEILEDLQKIEVKKDSLCFSLQKMPQYRLMTVPLKPENGVHSFLLTPFKKSLKKSLKNEIAKIATDTYQFSQGKVSSF